MAESSTAVRRPKRVILCENAIQEVVDLEYEAEYQYKIELARSGVDATLVSEGIPDVISGVTVEGVSSVLCAGIPFGESGGRRVQETKKCVISVSAGNDDVLDGSCQKASDEAWTCFLYQANVRVLYNSECSEDEIETATVNAIGSTYNADQMTQRINGEFSFAEESGVVYIGLSAEEAIPVPGITATLRGVESADDGISDGAKASILILLLLAFFIGLALFVKRRRSVRKVDGNDLDLEEGDNETSYRSKADRTLRSSKTSGNGSYLTADFKNLGLHHSKLDVHHCSSALCQTCRPTTGVVNMIRLPRLDSISLSPEAFAEHHIKEEQKEDNIETISPSRVSFGLPRDQSGVHSELTGDHEMSIVGLQQQRDNGSGGLQRTTTNTYEADDVDFVRVTSPRRVFSFLNRNQSRRKQMQL